MVILHKPRCLTSVAPPSGLHGNKIGVRPADRGPRGAPSGSSPPARLSPAALRPPARLQLERRRTASGLKANGSGDVWGGAKLPKQHHQCVACAKKNTQHG